MERPEGELRRREGGDLQERGEVFLMPEEFIHLFPQRRIAVTNVGEVCLPVLRLAVFERAEDDDAFP